MDYPPCTPDRPRLRPGLRGDQNPDTGAVILSDGYRLSPASLTMGVADVDVAVQADGTRTLAELAAAYSKSPAGPADALERAGRLFRLMGECGFLDTAETRERLLPPVRAPTCIGCYPADPDAVRQQLEGLFTAPNGPGLPGVAAARAGEGRLRAVLVPHMDYARGGVTYGHAFKELAERTDARLFVIVGTSHHSPARFTLTRQHFRTPLGVAETDQGFVDRLVAEYGPGLFTDPYAHAPEHSIELEVVLLQYLFEKRGPFRIVPLLTGSFQDAVRDHADAGPAALPEVARLVEALRRVEEQTPEPVCYVISGDLAHIGPKFGDRAKVSDEQLRLSSGRDAETLARLQSASPAEFFRDLAAERNRRRVCGLSPVWTALAAARPARGRVLHYHQYVAPGRSESVSFAAAAFTD